VLNEDDASSPETRLSSTTERPCIDRGEQHGATRVRLAAPSLRARPAPPSAHRAALRRRASRAWVSSSAHSPLPILSPHSRYEAGGAQRSRKLAVSPCLKTRPLLARARPGVTRSSCHEIPRARRAQPSSKLAPTISLYVIGQPVPASGIGANSIAVPDMIGCYNILDLVDVPARLTDSWFSTPRKPSIDDVGMRVVDLAELHA